MSRHYCLVIKKVAKLHEVYHDYMNNVSWNIMNRHLRKQEHEQVNIMLNIR